jgi:hypothetical protein
MRALECGLDFIQDPLVILVKLEFLNDSESEECWARLERIRICNAPQVIPVHIESLRTVIIGHGQPFKGLKQTQMLTGAGHAIPLQVK